MNLPHGYTNRTRLEDQVVVKAYSGVDARSRFLTELAMYQQLQARAFMPELLSCDPDKLTIRTRYIVGRHAQDLLEEHGETVPFVLGKLARTLQSVEIDAIGQQKRNASEVLVHGDFGPQNLLFAHESFSAPYLVDWEWAHFGDPFADIAWAEWIIRMHHAANPQMIASLYEGFGLVPAWETRHALMIRKCQSILDFARRDANAPAVAMWMDRVEQVKSWTGSESKELLRIAADQDGPLGKRGTI